MKRTSKATAKRRNGGAEKPVVLIVEDYSDAREMYAEYLEFQGFRVEQARNGKEAIARATRSPPDVVLMDLSLPVMDGWEATRRLKADERTRHVPVIALTGHALAGMVETATQAGCDGFITKPCLPEDLVAEIHKAIKTHARSRARS
ncbi:MAG TPA: response regulator [Myxococcaceae bacterium]|jgi:CheY-like chemotaxis protein|nr:response regulator [Myxococcaceae bacterium]